ncbi:MULTISPECIES: MG2 domain-containing protein [unclassified Mucilaginibacter]|uniref:MG2 domain-containing protein n=1 Tax=unclassified Mucilaginibacter TaxID=2617802 RepID=UPI002AC8C25D|nr:MULTISPECIES: MG2 domain-containing protein [unclassified Mucilaginibacter]MEB0263117.1 TonB-dependent receptor plug domain-containing protein [Mucilaginibacter sp. 10I4]MEB0277747.1 TonB-dependent receptor plug domain-containing protein [Mucilaginibacter sp. 10B2]MEB0303030.1 TonB-dependent receptor plug domain-containing protein [Mucilaginibacter sp. 5C4]WPX24628.1 TonB-dependent receptor plug domain-containing protein [Mucilaginibacter sp. 5C4]
MKKLFLMLFVAGCVNVAVQAQVAPQKTDVKDVVAKLQSLSTDKIIEKAYLHFDKPYYNPGDTLYFKAYITAGEQHELSKISGVLHVDLVSKNDSVMQSLILQLKNGLAWGDFSLPNYLSKGNYKVRAYTQWMQNAGNAYVFNKTISVNGKSIAQVYPAKATDNKTDVQFFPEGGSFVTAVPCRIAFKAVGSNGLGTYVKGTVVDSDNKEVAKFTSAHLGMGQFYITADAGKTYKAKVTYPDGSVNMVALPTPEAKGMSLTVNNSDVSKLAIDINANKAYYLENKDKEVNVVIYSAGVVKTVKTILDNQVIGFDLPKKDLKSGITQITVFAQNGVPLAERLVFIQNEDGINFTVNSDKATYAGHDKATITLNAKFGDKASVGNFSVAVIDESKVQGDEDKESSILSNLLLTSELRGYVEQPGYYFNTVNADTRSNLDVLMLTQGYRRVQWQELLNEPPTPLTYKPEFGIPIKGVLTNRSGAPIANEKLTLMLSATGQSITATTDAAGKFNFPDLEYADRSQFVLNIDNKALRNKAKLVIANNSSAITLPAYNEPAVGVVDNLSNYAGVTAGQTGKIRNLKPVYVKGKPGNYRTQSLAGAGNADQVIFGKDIKNFATLSQGLTGLARNIDFNNGKAYLKTSIAVANGSTVSEPMLIVIDGAITSGGIDGVQPNDVESIEILKGANAAVYGMGAGSGVMVINTKQGGDAVEVSKEMSPGILSLSPKGFYMAREFYSPVYDAVKKYPADERTTIYWKPNVITDAAGNAFINYFNAGAGRYRVIVEGIDNAGNIGRAVYKYNVQ